MLRCPFACQGKYVPQDSIPPGGVEGERADLVVPLDAVDGELPVGGGGGDVGGKSDDQAQGADDQDGPGNGQVSLPQEDDPAGFRLALGALTAKELHINPVLSDKRDYAPERNSCGKGAKKDGL